MKRFELTAGQPVIMSLTGTGIDALRFTVSGQSGAGAPTALMTQRVQANGAKALRVEHEFAAGQLDSYEQIQVDPIVYGPVGKGYVLTLTLRHRADDTPGYIEAAKGKLVSSKGSADPTDSGFDAPLFIVSLHAEPSVKWRVDEKTGMIVLDTIDLGLSPDTGSFLVGEPVIDPETLHDYTPVEPMTFDLDDLSGLGSIGKGGGGGSGAGAGAGMGKGLGLGGLSGLSDFASVGRTGWKREPRVKVQVVNVGGKEPAAATRGGGKRAAKAQAPIVAVQLPAVPETDDEAKHYPVWFGTNRAPVLKDGKVIGYSPYRDPDNVHFGRCIVRVPKSHKIGTTGSSLIKRIVKLTDDRLKVEELIEIEEKRFWTDIAKQIAAVAPDKQDAVVFIHGYNVSFSDAAIRAAQLGCDLAIDGAMAFYSWPSRGTLEGYPADEATVQASSNHITAFLTKIAVKSKAKNVHVIAHSMGNRATLEAVREIVAAAQKKSKRHFAQFILAAPDVDAEYFKQFATRYGKVARRTTMYVSDHDRAIAASRFLHGGVPRVGLAPPFQVIKGVDTVYAGYVDDTFLGHGYVAEAWQLLNDIHQLIHLDAPPAKRTWVKKAKAGNYWELVGRA